MAKIQSVVTRSKIDGVDMVTITEEAFAVLMMKAGLEWPPEYQYYQYTPESKHQDENMLIGDPIYDPNYEGPTFS